MEGLALTVLVMLPAVLLEPVPPAFQFQDTKLEPFWLTPVSLPNVKPLELNDVRALTLVNSESVAFE